MIDGLGLARLQEHTLGAVSAGQRLAWSGETAMDAAELASFLAEDRYCVLATSTPRSHRAVARPVSFCVCGTTFWFATVAGARLRNVERTPWASVAISEGGPGGHRAVTVDGPIEIVTTPDPEIVAAWQQRDRSEPTWAAAWLALAPERVLSYSSARGQ